MNGVSGLSWQAVAALHRLRVKREVNAVTLRYTDVPNAPKMLVPELGGT